jgi:signal transduction histidine kinase
MSDDVAEPTASPSACAVRHGSLPADSIDALRATIQGLEQELLASQRLALLGSMAAMVAHEFNNLLTPITARAEAALLSDNDLPLMRKALERALKQAQRAISVARRLLDLARDDQIVAAGPRTSRTAPAESCSVAAVVREAVETLVRPLEKDGIELRVVVPEELRVNAPDDLLCQVLLNLLLNARRAMQGTRGTLCVSAVAKGDWVQIDVRDSGAGIPPDALDRVVNPFLAADPHQRPNDWQQVGLGLSVCRMIAHHHGAIIRGLANEGRGCTFRLCWPAAGAEPLPPAGRC